MVEMSRADFEDAVRDALDGVPGDLARLMENVVVLVEDDAPDDDPDLRGRLGPDVEFVGRALGAVLGAFALPVSARVVAGFSDGASYALALGLANGDVFGDVVAYAPGYVLTVRHVGKPRVFVAHGTR